MEIVNMLQAEKKGMEMEVSRLNQSLGQWGKAAKLLDEAQVNEDWLNTKMEKSKIKLTVEWEENLECQQG
jgi:hypothetical protein